MNNYELGTKHGKAQFDMDKLTDTKREGEELANVAYKNWDFGNVKRDFPSLAYYISGFTQGYIRASQEVAS